MTTTITQDFYALDIDPDIRNYNINNGSGEVFKKFCTIPGALKKVGFPDVLIDLILAYEERSYWIYQVSVSGYDILSRNGISGSGNPCTLTQFIMYTSYYLFSNKRLVHKCSYFEIPNILKARFNDITLVRSEISLYPST